MNSYTVNSVYNRKRSGFNLKDLLICLILLATLFVSVSNILQFQAMASRQWWSYTTYSRLIVCFIDIFFLLICFSEKKVKFINLVSSEIFILIFYISVSSLLFYIPSTLHFIANTFAWPLTYACYYLYSKQYDFTWVYKKGLVICHLICFLFLIRTIMYDGYVNNNVGPVYHAIVYLPMILLLCNRKEKILLSLLAFIFVFATAKRVGILSLVFGFLGYFFIKSLLKTSFTKKIKSLFLFGISIICVAFFAVNYFGITDSLAFQRFEGISEDSGSGRLFMWVDILMRFARSPLTNKIFGHGFNAVPYQIEPFGKTIYAHCSYIEFLYDFGIVGVVLLLLVVVRMVLFVIRLIREKNELAPVASFAVNVVLCFSAASYFFDESNYIMMIMSCWGTIKGFYARKRGRPLLS